MAGTPGEPRGDRVGPASMAGGEGADRRGRWWPVFIILLFASQVLIWFAVYFIANADPSFAVEPGYYQKALDWDSNAAQLRANARLGWSVDVAIDAGAGLRDERVVVCFLSDRDGQGLDGAAIELTAFHHARGQQRTTLALEDVGGGRYKGELRMRKPGLWELRLVVERGSDRFTVVTQQIVPPGARTR